MKAYVARALPAARTAWAAAALLAGCSLGLVDVPLGAPAPATLSVVTTFQNDPTDPERIELHVEAALDPGVSESGVARSVAWEHLRVAGVDHAPTFREARTNRLGWSFVQRFPKPGPASLRIVYPRVDGVPTPAAANAQIGIRLTPADSVVLREDEDLVLSVDPPEAPVPAASALTADRHDWRLDLRSAASTFRLRLGASRWLDEVRVSSGRLPRSVLPLAGRLHIELVSAPAAVQGTFPAQYRVDIAATIVASFTVVAP